MQPVPTRFEARGLGTHLYGLRVTRPNGQSAGNTLSSYLEQRQHEFVVSSLDMFFDYYTGTPAILAIANALASRVTPGFNR